MDARDYVQAREDQGQTNGDEQDAESGRALDQLKDAGAVAFADDVEQGHTGENPPRISTSSAGRRCKRRIPSNPNTRFRQEKKRPLHLPEQRLVWPDFCVKVVDVVEEAEVVVDLQDDGRRGAGEGDEVDAFDP